MAIEFGYPQAFGLGLIFVISIILLRQKNRVQLNEPPLVPYKYPLIGHTFEYYKDVPGFLKKCREEYGEMFSLYIWGSVQTYVGKELYHELFKNYNEFDFHSAIADTFPMVNFLNRPENYFRPIGRFVKDFLRDLEKYTARVQYEMIKSFDEFINNEGVFQPPLQIIELIIARPLAATFVGDELCKDKELLNTFAYILDDMNPWLAFPPALNFIYPNLHRKFLSLRFRFDNPIRKHQNIILSKITPVIKQRIKDKNSLGDSWKRPNDIMQDLMEEYQIDENNVDIRNVADFLMNFIFSSVHSTSIAFTYCLHEYINNPEYHNELLEEAEGMYNEYKHLPYYTPDILDKMVKMGNFIKETLRVNWHDVSLPHKVMTSQFTFGNGYQVPEGRVFQIFTQLIHHDPKVYGPTPENFNPNHHKNSPAHRPERHFLAFGMGREACPGRFFAINELKVALHFIILKYNIKGVSGKRIEPKRMGGFLFPSDEGIIFEKKLDSIVL
ncbi:cytochrome P450 [Glomus cerebriforme]|uniref:Cytochrome P450 n=1 Tax=Glomus cerebriforme TaxID=658196 RepID=A0A397SQ66_9GLOM|nr:cytochrome P450 [Glomus cerebriforme]